MPRKVTGLYKRGEKWYGWWFDGTGQRQKRVLSTDKAVAVQILNSLRSQADFSTHGLGAFNGQTRDVREIFDEFFADLSARARASTIERTERAFDEIKKELVPGLRVKELTPELVGRLVDTWRGLGNANRTINIRTGRMKVALNWAVDTGRIGQNPIARLKPLPETGEHRVKERRAMTNEEVATFLVGAREDDERRASHRAAKKTIKDGTKGAEWNDRERSTRVPQAPLFRLLLETGIRIGEATRLLGRDVDLEKRTVRVRASIAKNAQEDWLPLGEALCDELRAMRAVQAKALGREPGPSEIFFLGPDAKPILDQRNVLRAFYAIVDAKDMNSLEDGKRVLDVHSLRVTFISGLARAGVNLQTAQKLARHRSVQLTAAVYTKLTLHDVRGAVAKLPWSVGDGTKKPRSGSGQKTAKGSRSVPPVSQAPETQRGAG